MAYRADKDLNGKSGRLVFLLSIFLLIKSIGSEKGKSIKLHSSFNSTWPLLFVVSAHSSLLNAISGFRVRIHLSLLVIRLLLKYLPLQEKEKGRVGKIRFSFTIWKEFIATFTFITIAIHIRSGRSSI